MTSSKIAFLFPGQGSHYPGLLRELARDHRQVMERAAAADPIVERFFGRRISPLITGGEEGGPLEFERSQVLIFLAGVVMHEVLVDEGIRPDVLVGHSLGELAALVAGGMIDFETGLRLVCQRTAALRQHSVDGAMLALTSEAQRVERLMQLLEPLEACIAVRNAPAQVVVSGRAEALARIEAVTRSMGLVSHRLDAAFPFHSPWMEGVSRELHSVFGEVVARSPRTRVYSPIALAEYAEGDALGRVLAEHLVRPVDFAEAVVRLYESGVRVFIEAGGRSALSTLARDTLAGRAGVVTLASNEPKRGEQASLAAVLSQCEGLGLLRRVEKPAPADLEDRLTRMTPAQLVEEIQKLAAALAASLGMSTPSIHMAPVAPPPEPALQPPSQAPAVEPAVEPTVAQDGESDRSELTRRIVSIYQKATDYPAEVFEPDADLEAELGIDSVKQLQILALLQEEFQLPEFGQLKVKDFSTLSRVVELISRSRSASSPSTLAA